MDGPPATPVRAWCGKACAGRNLLYTGGKDYCYWCAPYPNGPEDPANRHVNHEWTPEERGFIISHVYSINQLAEKQ